MGVNLNTKNIYYDIGCSQTIDDNDIGYTQTIRSVKNQWFNDPLFAHDKNGRSRKGGLQDLSSQIRSGQLFIDRRVGDSVIAQTQNVDSLRKNFNQLQLQL
ncbi:hypothetical protein ACTFIT_005801 [Dictyostelium discoideum]